MLNLIQHPGVDPESSSGWRIQAIERELLSSLGGSVSRCASVVCWMVGAGRRWQPAPLWW